MMCRTILSWLQHDYTVNEPTEKKPAHRGKHEGEHEGEPQADQVLAIACLSPRRLEQARYLSGACHEPLSRSAGTGAQLELRLHDDLVELYDNELCTSISIDFTHGTLAHRQQYGGGKGQAIAKAAGMKSGRTPSILDVTAGLAGDAYVLATLGCPVTMLERSPVNAALIVDAIERASLSEEFQHILEQGFTFLHTDANEYMRDCTKTPDVIYIDPMYPERKKSALVKKDMQILQKLLQNEADAATNEKELLENALDCADRRVVVKRPLQAPTLNERKPSTTVSSKKTRYDIYVLMGM